MQWGGSLGEIFDSSTQTAVTVRGFGTFEGTADPAVVLEAVSGAAARRVGSVLSTIADTRGVAAAAQHDLAARGVVGELTISALSISAEDHERLQAAAIKAAMAARARK
jgi:hypothetical protein